MKKPSRLDYAYAVGRVRVLENKLVGRAIFREASEQSDFSSALKVIFDAGDFQEEMILSPQDLLMNLCLKDQQEVKLYL